MDRVNQTQNPITPKPKEAPFTGEKTYHGPHRRILTVQRNEVSLEFQLDKRSQRFGGGFKKGYPIKGTHSDQPFVLLKEKSTRSGGGTLYFEGRVMNGLIKSLPENFSQEFLALSGPDGFAKHIEYHSPKKNSKRPALVLPMAEGHLGQLLTKPDQTSPDRLWVITSLLARQLDLLHAGGFAHRDIKPDNVLLYNLKSAISGRATTRVLLSDFGLSVPLDGRRVSLGGTYEFFSPEMFRAAFSQFHGPIDLRKADVYAFGMTLFALKEKGIPERQAELGELIRQIKGAPDPQKDALRLHGLFQLEYLVQGYNLRLANRPLEGLSLKDFLDLVIHRSLHPDPLKRPSMREITMMLAGRYRLMQAQRV